MSFTGSSPLSAVLTDSRGYALSSSTPIPVNPAEAGAANYATAQINVTNAVTQIVNSRSTRRAVLIINIDATNTVYLGSASATSSTGHALPPGASIVIPITIAIWGITASSTAKVTAIEVFD